MLKYSFIFLFVFSNLYADSRLTIPKDIDMGVIPIGIERDSYIEIKNNTKDTFMLDYINYYQQYSLNISFSGNYIYSLNILRSSDQSPILILPNEIRTFNYEIYSKFEDSVSLSGGKLKYFFDLGYYKYGTNKLIKDSFNMSFTCKNIIDSVFVISSGLRLDFYNCASNFSNTNIQDYLLLFNN